MGQEFGSATSRCSLGSPGSRSSSATMLSPSGLGLPAGLCMPGSAGATGYGYNCSPVGMPTHAVAAANLPMLVMNSNMPSASPVNNVQQPGGGQMLGLDPQGPSSSGLGGMAAQQDIQQQQETSASHAAVQLAALQLQYDEHLRKAELAAARAEATSNTLQAVVAALGRSATGGTALNSSPLGARSSSDWAVQQHAGGLATSSTAELAGLSTVPVQQHMAAGGEGQYLPGMMPVMDQYGSITYLPTGAWNAVGAGAAPGLAYGSPSTQYAGLTPGVSFDLEFMGLGAHPMNPTAIPNSSSHSMQPATGALDAAQQAQDQTAGVASTMAEQKLRSGQ